MSFYVAAEPRGETHPVDEVLPPTKLAVYGAQHVLAFYAGAVIVPILLASAIGLRGEDLVYLISADLLTCGIASLIQAVGFWKVGVRLPLLQGVTFTAVAPMIAIGTANGGGVDGLLAIYGAVIVAGVVTFFAAPYFSRLLRLFPPVVTGTVITVIGVTLLPVAAQQAGGGNPARRRLRLLPEHRAGGRDAGLHRRAAAAVPRRASWLRSRCCWVSCSAPPWPPSSASSTWAASPRRMRSASPRRSTSGCRRSASPRSPRC